MQKKNHKWWSDPVVVNFFEMFLIQYLCSENHNFRFNYFWTYNDWIRPPLVSFLSFLKKNYSDWIKGKHPKSRFKWTGLRSAKAVISLRNRGSLKFPNYSTLILNKYEQSPWSLHSDLDHRIVSKKVFQTSFSGQKHLFTWHLQLLMDAFWVKNSSFSL